MNLRFSVFVVALSLSGATFAQLEFSLHERQGTALGAERRNGSAVGYGGTIYNNTNSGVFINSYEFVQLDGDWSNLALTASPGLANYFGRELSSHGLIGSSYPSGLFRIDMLDEVNTLVGERTGTITLRGGATAQSNDLLGTDLLTLDLYSDHGGLTSEILNPDQTIAPGAGSDPYRWRINTGFFPIWATILLTVGPSTTDVSPQFLDWPTRGNYNHMLARGEVWEEGAVRYFAAPNAPTGEAEFNLYAVGGRYFEDEDLMTVNPHIIRVVVPEPTTSAALALGLVALGRRQRARR